MLAVIHALLSMHAGQVACGASTPLHASLNPTYVTCARCRQLLAPMLSAPDADTPAGSDMPEKTVLAAVRAAASGAGYVCYHTWNSQHSEPGFPDVVLARPGAPLWCLELKTARGKLTREQAIWQQALTHATGVQYAVLRPQGLQAFITRLREE